ncbi:hypothetical protein HZC33_01955 [Candidatus Wolfebacteria bacterium]|nr:hypothetical protein [Candidatus Wolfebacteria bacterium]
MINKLKTKLNSIKQSNVFQFVFLALLSVSLTYFLVYAQVGAGTVVISRLDKDLSTGDITASGRADINGDLTARNKKFQVTGTGDITGYSLNIAGGKFKVDGTNGKVTMDPSNFKYLYVINGLVTANICGNDRKVDSQGFCNGLPSGLPSGLVPFITYNGSSFSSLYTGTGAKSGLCKVIQGPNFDLAATNGLIISSENIADGTTVALSKTNPTANNSWTCGFADASDYPYADYAKFIYGKLYKVAQIYAL